MEDFDADLNSVWGELDATDAVSSTEEDHANNDDPMKDAGNDNAPDDISAAQGAAEDGEGQGESHDKPKTAAEDDDPLDDVDIGLLEEIANDGEQPRQSVQENVIPAQRVAQLIDQIRGYAEAAGVDAPDFGDPVAMPASDFKELTTTRDRLRIRAAASQVEIAEPSQPVANQPQQDQQQEPDFDVAANRRAWREAFLDGDEDRAEQLEREYIEYNERRLQAARDEAARTAAEKVKQEMLQAQERATYQSELRRIVEENPFLADNNFDNKAAEEMTQWRDFYAAQGKSDIEALQLAAERVLPLYQPQQPAPAPDSKSDKPDPRQAKAMERAAAASRAQPPALDAGLGERAVPPLPDVNNMDPDDWARLPEKERMRLLA